MAGRAGSVHRTFSCWLASVWLIAAPGLAQTPQAEEAERARTAMAEGRLHEAVAIYTRLADEFPTQAALQMNLGMALVMSGQPAKAVPRLQRATKLNRALMPGWLFLGIAYLDLNRPADAVPPLRTALKADPANLDARRALAQALETSGRLEQAAAEYRRLTSAVPSSDAPQTWYALAMVYSELTRRTFESLRQLAPDSPYEWVIQGDLALADEQPDVAVGLLERAVQRDASVPAAYDRLARAYEQSNRAGDAAAAAAHAQEVRRTCTGRTAECELVRDRPLAAANLARGKLDARSLYVLTQAYNALGVQAMQRLETLPPSAALHLVRATVFEGQRRRLEAAAELRSAHRLEPDNARVTRALAEALTRTREHEEAIPYLRELLAKTPDDPELHALAGENLLGAQRIDEAITHLERAVGLAPTLVPARASLGRAYALAGRLADALPHLEATRQTDQDGSLLYQLARAYQAAGRTAEAAAAMKDYEARQATAAPPTTSTPPR